MDEPGEPRQGNMVHVPALAEEIEGSFWKSLLRVWPEALGARVTRLSASARLGSGLYLAVSRFHDQVPFAHSVRIWTRTAYGEVPLLHFHTPSAYPDPQIAQEQIGVDPSPLWIDHLRHVLQSLSDATTTDTQSSAPPLTPVWSQGSTVSFKPASTETLEPSQTPPGDIMRWLRGEPRPADEAAASSHVLGMAVTSPHPDPASASNTSTPTGDPTGIFEELRRTYDGVVERADRLRRELAAACQEAAPNANTEVGTDAWRAIAVSLDRTPEAGADRIRALGPEWERSLGVAQGWAEALATACRATFGGHIFVQSGGQDASAIRCERCGAANA